MFPTEPGLTDEEVKKRQEQFGLNVLPEKPPPSIGILLLRQIKNPLIYVLLGAFVITLIVGHFSDATIIILAVFINTFLGFIQEHKASRTLFALKQYIVAKVTVIREGKRIHIHASHIVPEDMIILSQGTKVPADGVIVQANRLYINESVLTGESMPVEKSVSDAVYMGTTISSGQAVMRTTATGVTTRFGTIAKQIQEPDEETPLQRQLRLFSKRLVGVVSILLVIVFITGIIYRYSITDIFLTSVALAVSSIPEGLIVSLTIILAIGMQRILLRQGLVKTLQAAETLGSVNVVCVDKTGTLTQGNMKVEANFGNTEDLAKQVLLANDLDDPLVIAAFEWGRTYIHDFISEFPRLDSIPFSSKTRYFVCLNQWTDGKRILFVNGAPEVLLHKTTVSPGEKEEILRVIADLTREGKRVIGYVQKLCDSDKKHIESDDTKSGFTWVGLLAFADPVRAGVKEALQETFRAGVHTIVITGDYPTTARAVMNELGIPVTDEEILTGDILETLSSSDLRHKIKKIRLFARTTPDQKLSIVEALKSDGYVVAMMGDGVNDAPALHKADIGIVVEEATDVAKDAADLILLDSNFATITAAIEEGRMIFDNIRKIILYLMSDAFAEISLILGGIILGLPLPLTAVQILWINLVSDGFPSLALTVDPKRKTIMHEKPRGFGEPLVNRWMMMLMVFVSGLSGGIALFAFIGVYHISHDVDLARSFAFIVLGINSLSYVFSVRSLMIPFWKDSIIHNKWLIGAVIAGYGLQIVPFFTPDTRKFFGLTQLHPYYWVAALLLAVCVFLSIELFKVAYRYYKQRSW